MDRDGVRFVDRATATEELIAIRDVARVSVRQGSRSFELLIEPKAGPAWVASLSPTLAAPTTFGIECSSLLGLGPDKRLMEFRNPTPVPRFVVSWAIGALLGSLIGGTIISLASSAP